MLVAVIRGGRSSEHEVSLRSGSRLRIVLRHPAEAGSDRITAKGAVLGIARADRPAARRIARFISSSRSSIEWLSRPAGLRAPSLTDGEVPPPRVPSRPHRVRPPPGDGRRLGGHRPDRHRRPRGRDPLAVLGPRSGLLASRCTTWPRRSASPGHRTSPGRSRAGEPPLRFGVLRGHFRAAVENGVAARSFAVATAATQGKAY